MTTTVLSKGAFRRVLHIPFTVALQTTDSLLLWLHDIGYTKVAIICVRENQSECQVFLCNPEINSKVSDGIRT